jgi:hypothetical protein
MGFIGRDHSAIKSTMDLHDGNWCMDSWNINLDLLSLNQEEIERGNVKLKWRFIFGVSLLSIALVGCAGGGGGTAHVPPKQIIAGQPTPLTLEVSVWGAGWGKMTSRYRNVTCHYRLLAEQEYHNLPMMPEKEFTSKPPFNKEGSFQCTLPALPKTAKVVEYYFDFTFDKFRQARPPVTVPIVSQTS